MIICHGNDMTPFVTAWSSLRTKLSIVENQLGEMIPFEQVEILEVLK